MNSIFLTILSMSLTATIVALVVMLVRLCLKRAPKMFSYALWALVLFRMVCPMSFSSDISFVPDFNEVTAPMAHIETTRETPAASETEDPQINDQSDSVVLLPETYMIFDEAAQNYDQSAAPEEVPADTKQPVPIISILSYIWVAGVAAMLTYALASYIWMYRKISDATKIKDNIFEGDKIQSPFVFGIIKPKIYMPICRADSGFTYIIEHERTHIRRGDHIARPIFWVALAVHWFNPLMWLCFFLMNRDMELSCDEYVIRTAGKDIRAVYSKIMLAMAVRRNNFIPMPLAFGETSVKTRIKSALNYKKPAFWVTMIVALVVIAISATLIGNATVFGGGVDAEWGIGEPETSQSELETIDWKNDSDLSLNGKILRIDDWIYYVPDYNYEVYRMREDGSAKEALFVADLGQCRGGGVTSLTRCGDYLLFTHAAYIYKMDVNTLKTEVLVQADDPSTCFDLAVKDNKVYFVGTNTGADYLDGIYEIDVNGTDPKRITQDVSGNFWKIQIFDNKIYVSAQGAGLWHVNLDGSDPQKIPNVVDHSVGDFIVYDEHVFWLTYDWVLFGADLSGNNRIEISGSCTGFIIKDGKLIYSEIKSKSSGIFMCDLDGKNQKIIYKGIASVMGSCGNRILIDNDSGVFELHDINIIGDKIPATNSNSDSKTAKVTSKEEFIEAIADRNVEAIEVVADITLDGSGYHLYSDNNKQMLTIDKGATLTISTSNLMLSGCKVVNNGTITVSGRILTYDEVEFSGSGIISCTGYGTIECYIQSNPTTNTLKRLLSKNSVYTNVSVRAWSETQLVITENLEISKGKTLEVYKYDEDYTLVVPKGVTLTNNGTLKLSSQPKIEGSYKGNGTVYVQGKVTKL